MPWLRLSLGINNQVTKIKTPASATAAAIENVGARFTFPASCQSLVPSSLVEAVNLTGTTLESEFAESVLARWVSALMVRSSSANALAEGYRSSGAFARHFEMIGSSAG